MRFTKALVLDRLVTELQAAGVQVTRLGSNPVGAETEVYTYNVAGEPIDLPEAARAVIDAHDGRTEEEQFPFNYSAAPNRTQVRTGVDTMQAYIDNPSPNNADSISVVKVLCRAFLYVARRLGL